MEIKQEIFIHAGYPKSGSTSLQENLFAKHSSIAFLAYAKFDPDINLFYRMIRDLPEGDESDKKIMDFYKAKISPKLPLAGKIIFSYEDLVNSVSPASNELKAKRLKRLFPKARVMLVIRNQFEIIRSRYSFASYCLLRDRKGDNLVIYPDLIENDKIIDYNEWLRKSLANLEFSFLDGLDYTKLIKLYQNLFGPDKLRVFLLEELAESPEKFANEISQFLRVNSDEALTLLRAKKQNVARSELFKKAIRLKKKLIPNINLEKVLPKKVNQALVKVLNQGEKENLEIDKEIRQEIHELYRDSNEELSQILKTDLSKFNYPF